MRLLRAQASAAPADAAGYDPTLGAAGARRAGQGRGAHRLAQPGGAAGRARGGRACCPTPAPRCSTCSARDADPAADAAALRKLALWCLRYTPPWRRPGTRRAAPTACSSTSRAARISSAARRSCWPISAGRLRAFGLYPRTAIADTAGAAWAMARHGPVRPAGSRIVPSGEERAALSTTCRSPRSGCRRRRSPLMRRLGFKRIGEIIDQPRAPFAARFEPEVLQPPRPGAGARARAARSLSWRRPPITPARTFLEPILSQEHVLEAATRLLRELADATSGAMASAHASCGCCCSSMDGEVQSLDLGLAAPSRDPEHIARSSPCASIACGDDLEADFGFEAAAVHVLVAEPLSERQEHARPRRGGCRARGARPADRPPAAAAGRRRRLPAHPRTRATRPSAPCAPASPSPRFRGERVRVRGGADSAGKVAPTPNPSPRRGMGRGSTSRRARC